MMRLALLSSALAAVLPAVSLTNAAPTPEEACQAGRERAAARYASCARAAAVQDYLATVHDSSHNAKLNAAPGKCVMKYAAAWTRIRTQERGTGSACDSLRFVDNGDGTVTDHLTALQWEKKTNLDGIQDRADPHDADNNFYFWSISSGAPADGTVFTTFLRALNSGACFAGQCDWRLPTRDELMTIVMPAYPACTKASTACVDPIFGPTARARYWSGTTFGPLPDSAFFVDFRSGAPGADSKLDAVCNVRAVRAGL